VITIVDYGVGNIGALENMFDFLGVDCTVSNRPEDVGNADKLLLPGVGAFDTAVNALNRQNLIPALNYAVCRRKRPILGVCLGMQLLCRGSQEGDLPGLGWIDADVRRLEVPSGSKLKVPHIGWADVRPIRETNLFPKIHSMERFYFVHSYHVCCDRPNDVAAVVDFGREICCSVSAGNIYGVQFHPEKSHRFGMRLLKAFGDL
jgi:glutamine amidotransferase